jgi:hypothetical protein
MKNPTKHDDTDAVTTAVWKKSNWTGPVWWSPGDP